MYFVFSKVQFTFWSWKGMGVVSTTNVMLIMLFGYLL